MLNIRYFINFVIVVTLEDVFFCQINYMDVKFNIRAYVKFRVFKVKLPRWALKLSVKE